MATWIFTMNVNRISILNVRSKCSSRHLTEAGRSNRSKCSSRHPTETGRSKCSKSRLRIKIILCYVIFLVQVTRTTVLCLTATIVAHSHIQLCLIGTVAVEAGGRVVAAANLRIGIVTEDGMTAIQDTMRAGKHRGILRCQMSLLLPMKEKKR